ncbi:hypothetical protein OG417_50910 [Actinoallomurus sp. NBC_01490]|uniref:hypothetical protein n=1 Tax=Actinoallomurus sp. NBC_01490 TaxID=2903557 RepID=UPI002E326207|nr:hypothetical protein [Actinoallomurus sp. NBC_01490]
MTYPNPPTNGAQMPGPFIGEYHPAIEQFRLRHRRVIETLTYAPPLPREEPPWSNDHRPDAPQAATREIITATRDFVCATEPLITYLPAIIAALSDAADCRRVACKQQGADSRCASQPLATTYEAALQAIIG